MSGAPDERDGVAEEITGGEDLPVLAQVRAIEPSEDAEGALVALGSPAAQVAAVGAAGLVAGAATFVAIRRASSVNVRKRRSARRARKRLGDVVASRSFLVDVHLLDRD